MIAVDYTAQPGQRVVADGQGQAVPPGVRVSVGRLTGPLPREVSCAAVGALWQSFAETLTRSLANQAGRFTAAAARDEPEFSQQKIYLFIRQTAGGAVPRADAANVLAWGLFSSGAAGWVFPDAEALAPGNATLITSSEVSEAWGGRLSASALELGAVPSAAAAYAAWAGELFGAAGAARAGALADPDGDGLANAWECLYGTHPLLSNGNVLMLEVEAGGVRLTFPRRAALPPGYEQVEVSADLVHWGAAPTGSLECFEVAGAARYFFPGEVLGKRSFFRLALPWLR